MHRYSGKDWSNADIDRIRGIIANNPTAKRAKLAQLVCASFDWNSINGQPKLMSCRVAMIRMHEQGLIQLPEPRQKPGRRTCRQFSSPASDPQPEINCPIGELSDLCVELVTPGTTLALWNEYISRYHYLGYKTMPGAQLRYLIYARGQVLGAMGYSAAAWKVAPRDKFIGWTPEKRVAKLHLIVNQTRFLILPWVHCKNLATRTLSLVARRIGDDWQSRYGYRPVLMETFVDDARFRGTCYKAGNWQHVGLTQGRTKFDRYHVGGAPVKSIWLMPLRRDFRRHLLAD